MAFRASKHLHVCAEPAVCFWPQISLVDVPSSVSSLKKNKKRRYYCPLFVKWPKDEKRGLESRNQVPSPGCVGSDSQFPAPQKHMLFSGYGIP